MSTERFISERDAASMLGLSAVTLRMWRHQSTGPAYRRFGRAIRYSVNDLNAFADSRRIVPVGEV